jgi:RNA polymerase sigma factor (TIGR02999 family)
MLVLAHQRIGSEDWPVITPVISPQQRSPDMQSSELSLNAATPPSGSDVLFATLYEELHRLARHHLHGGSELSLGTTTLLHEAYLNLQGRHAEFPDRSRFLGYASRAMRGLVIDFARRRRALKRGSEFCLVSETDHAGVIAENSDQALDSVALERLSDALTELATLEPALAELVDLHVFCGFGLSEIASQRSVSERTVQRDWRKVRLLLRHLIIDTPDEHTRPQS